MPPPGSDVLSCPVADDCGACALIGRPYDEQLKIKTDRVRAALEAWPALPADRVDPCLPAPHRAAYRNRAKLAVARGPEGVRIGLHRRGTSRIVDLAPCRVQRPVLQEAVERLRRWLERRHLARPAGPVIYLDLRESAGERCHVTLVLDGAAPIPGKLPLDELAGDWPALAGVAVNLGDARSSYPMGRETRVVRGDERFEVRLPSAGGSELCFEVPPAGFFQVAPSALAAVHERMARHLGHSDTLHDLYCGVGVHGLAVAAGASGARRIVGVESSLPLVEAARRNATRMAIEARYEAGRVEERLDLWKDARADAGIILNPGRAGCRPPVLDALVQCRAEKLAYLSCNPETLARDLATLLRGGLDLVRVVPVDLMPQTDHLEALALLKR